MIESRFSAGPLLVWTLVFFAASFSAAWATEQPGKSSTTAKQESADEAAIREAGQAFITSFNANDAASVATLWTTDGEFINESGERFTGRDEIQSQYDKFFKEYPGVQIQVKTSKLKMLSPTSAIGEGVSMLGAPDAPSPVYCEFLVVRVKQNGRWLISSAHDLRTKVEEKLGNLADLEGMIGKWQLKSDNGVYETECRWIANKKFVERTYSVNVDGTVSQSGKQIIGLEPTTQQIVSWLFDSSGGHDIGNWTRQGDSWIVEANGALADGTVTRSLNQMKHLDENTIEWKSVNRYAGDERLPDTEAVVLKRVSGVGSGN